MSDQVLVHDHPEFEALLSIVSERLGIGAALVEKDYWITHTLWALEEAGLQIHFKGGTSLSKGFGLIERFSEDLDVKIEAPILFAEEFSNVAAGLTDNRPTVIHCVRPEVTLLEKVQAISRRYGRDPFDAAGFVRHYENATRILVSDEVGPHTKLRRLLHEMRDRGMAIGPIFWGERIALRDCAREIQRLLRVLAA